MPDWKDAPEWAQWLVYDSAGWWWFATEPELHCGEWLPKAGKDRRYVLAANGQQPEKHKRPA